MVLFIVSLVIVAIAIMMVITQRQSVNNMKRLLKQAQEKTIQLEGRVDSSRDELRKSKEELEREKTALREAREQAKKKLRRQASAEMDEQFSQSEAAVTNKVFEDSQKAVVAMEAQIEQLKKEQGQHEDALRANLASEFSKKEIEKVKEIEELKKKISELQEDLKKQRRLLRPEGVKIDLKSLPDEAASEFARVYRKAEQHERLHGIARAKLHLAQEKFTELQKRYFTVCRELAMAAGNKADLEPAAARDIAEKMVGESHSDETEHSEKPQSDEHA